MTHLVGAWIAAMRKRLGWSQAAIEGALTRHAPASGPNHTRTVSARRRSPATVRAGLPTAVRQREPRAVARGGELRDGGEPGPVPRRARKRARFDRASRGGRARAAASRSRTELGQARSVRPPTSPGERSRAPAARTRWSDPASLTTPSPRRQSTQGAYASASRHIRGKPRQG